MLIWGKRQQPIGEVQVPPPGLNEENPPTSAPPKQFYYSSGNGQILSVDGQGYVLPQLSDISIEKIQYIPKDYASQKLDEVVKENQKMKTIYDENIDKLNKHHKATLEAAKNHYEKLVNDLKTKAQRHVEVQKIMKQQLEEKLSSDLKASEDTIEDLRDKMATLNREYQDEVRNLKAKIQRTEQRLRTYQNNLVDQEVRNVAKQILTEMKYNIELKITGEKFSDGSNQLVQQIRQMTDDFKDMLQQEQQQHATVISTMQDEQQIRHECSIVINDMLMTIEINDLKENIRKVALITEELTALKELSNVSQEQLQARQDELHAAAANHQQLIDENTKYQQDLEALHISYEQEKTQITESHQSEVNKLKEQFGHSLHSLQTTSDRQVVKLCLTETILRVVERSLAEETAMLYDNMRKSSANHQDALQGYLQDHQSQLSTNKNSFQDQLHTLEKKYQKEIHQLHHKNDRLIVELTVQAIIDKVIHHQQEQERKKAHDSLYTMKNQAHELARQNDQLSKQLKDTPPQHIVHTEAKIAEAKSEAKHNHDDEKKEHITEVAVVSGDQSVPATEELESLRKELLDAQQIIHAMQDQQRALQEQLTQHLHQSEPTAVTSEHVNNIIAPVIIHDNTGTSSHVDTSTAVPIVINDAANDNHTTELEVLKQQLQAKQAELTQVQTTITKHTHPSLEDSKVKRDEVKNEIKEWTKQFIEENNREPEVGDKAKVKDKYQRYKNCGSKVKELEDELNKQEGQKKTLEEEVKQIQSQINKLLVAKSDGHQPTTTTISASEALSHATLTTTANTADTPTVAMKVVVPTADAEIQVSFSELRKQQSTLHATTDTPATTGNEQVDYRQHMEQLEDDLYEIQHQLDAIKLERQQLQEERDTLSNQLAQLIAEKRTDIVKRFEDNIAQLTQTNHEYSEKIITLTTEKGKLEQRVIEFKSRTEAAEQELKERDDREKQQLNEKDEKFQLKTQINKQRDQIILKSKAATAGWDAAATSDERLELEVQKAYQKALKDMKSQHQKDLESMNIALEKKETRITDLLVTINGMEKQVKDSVLSKEQMKTQMANMQLEVNDAIASIQSLAAVSFALQNKKSDGSGDENNADNYNDNPMIDDGDFVMPPTYHELENTREQLDTAQDELVNLIDRCDRLEGELEVCRRKNRLFEKLAEITGFSEGTMNPTANNNATMRAATAAGNANDPKRLYDVEDIVNNIKKAIAKCNNLWKSNRKDDTYDVYLEASLQTASRLLTEDLVKPLKDCIENGRIQGAGNKQRGSVALRKGLERVLNDLTNNSNNLRTIEEDAGKAIINAQADQKQTLKTNQLNAIEDLVKQIRGIDNDVLEQGFTKEKNPTNSSAAGTVLRSPRAALEEAMNAGDEQMIEEAKQQIQQLEEHNLTNKMLLERAKTAEELVKSLRKQLASVIAATNQNLNGGGGSGGGGTYYDGNNNSNSSGAAVSSHARPTTASNRPTTSSTGRNRSNNNNNNNNNNGGPPMNITMNAAANSNKGDAMEVRRLQRKVKELETQIKSLQSGGGNGGGGGAGGNAGGGGGGNTTAVNSAELKALQQNEKALQKKLKDQETSFKRDMKQLEMKATKSENALQKINNTYTTIVRERDELRTENAKLQSAATELVQYKEKAQKFAEMEVTLATREQELTSLQDQFKKESALRKKYKNELEDLKGAIRVYARCRPMARYELEKGCKCVVDIKDETSLKLVTQRGEKDYEFDAVFSPTSTQDQVFEDTKRLVESCIDGFNVCLFAYGQTGSGKTFTMTGSTALPGLTPKAINELYRLIAEKNHLRVKVTTYFVELYNDNLVDLYWILDNKGNNNNNNEPPKLEIKMDNKKMVYIRNAVIKDVFGPDELMDLFNKGNVERHTGATKMNAESSRSHSIFAINVECYDSTTKRTTNGKLSLVDLAGSERADKTGAGAERLREAQSINKSLSALGDVIAALSEGNAKFVPYRNNKLTQLMQDSLGGNAKTLMFVNFSPADYNADETNTSLMYAARVKKIVNNASKQAESEEVARLKAMIRRLQSGQSIADLEQQEQQEDAEKEAAMLQAVAEEDGKVYDGY